MTFAKQRSAAQALATLSTAIHEVPSLATIEISLESVSEASHEHCRNKDEVIAKLMKSLAAKKFAKAFVAADKARSVNENIVREIQADSLMTKYV